MRSFSNTQFCAVCPRNLLRATEVGSQVGARELVGTHPRHAGRHHYRVMRGAGGGECCSDDYQCISCNVNNDGKTVTGSYRSQVMVMLHFVSLS